MDYDPADNARQCYALAIREMRLERIRRGLSHPRAHCPIEMSAWREGVIARTAIVGAVVAAFVVVGVVATLIKESPPAGKSVASAAIGERK